MTKRLSYFRQSMAVRFSLFLGVLLSHSANGQTAFRGTWADAFHMGFKNAGQVDQLVEYAVQGHYNAIIAEVMAYYDNDGAAHGAYWTSDYVPKAPDVASGFDPLAYLCQQAHAQGLEVHAWLVTYRVSDTWPPSGNTIIAAHPEWIDVPYDDIGTGPKPVKPDPDKPSTWYYMLDPGSPGVQNYLLDIVRELVTQYPIDGINWDYIRYTQTDGGYPSDNNYYYSSLKRFQRIYNRSDVPAIGDLAWSDFRRRTIDELVSRCRAEIPRMTSARQPLRLTADVLAAGNYTGSFSSSTAYIYFQNWKYWMDMGWLDGTVPMNYKREHCPSEATMYRNWVNAAVSWKNGRHVYCGHAAYLNSMPNSVTQMSYSLSQGADGVATYSYYATRATEDLCDGQDAWVNDWGWYAYVAQNIFTSPVEPPEMPWRSPDTATDGTIWGQVFDASTGLPVDDAYVVVASRSGTRSDYTDGNGYYVTTLLPAIGTGINYTALVTKEGLPSGSYAYGLAVPGEVRRYDVTLGALPPRIAIDGSEASIVLTREIDYGSNPNADTFTISAANWPTNGSLNYTVSPDVPWLGATPAQDTSNGESDTIAINYETVGLEPGQHTGIITVSDPFATANPRTVTVELTVRTPSIPGDFDGDQDVDQEDLAKMQVCLTGPTVPQDDPECQGARLDGDSDVDQDDMRLFLGCLSGPQQMGDYNCLSN